MFNRLFFVLFLGRVGSTSGTHHLARGLFCPSLFFHQTSSEAEAGNLGSVEALLGANADVDLQGVFGDTALHCAVKIWRTKCRKNNPILISLPNCAGLHLNTISPSATNILVSCSPPPPSSPIPRCVGDAALDTFFVVLPVFTSWKVARYPGR